MIYTQLKERHRAEREGWPENLGLRVHRALSWLDRAEQLEQQGDVDGEFIFLWIAFNAAYATDIDEKYRESEQQTFRGFLAKLDGLDAPRQRFEHLVWVGERGVQRRLTRCQAARANTGTEDVPAGTPRSRDSAASGPRSIRVLLNNRLVFGGQCGPRDRLTGWQAVGAYAGTVTCRLVCRGVGTVQRAAGGRTHRQKETRMLTSVRSGTICPSSP